MKYLLFFLFAFNLEAVSVEVKEPKYTASIVPKNMSVKEKKARFYYLVVPAIYKVYNELLVEYHTIKANVDANITTPQLLTLKAIYHVETNEDLLLALKPHPKSIAIAQAAMESAWGTSRFFREANNIFGMWSKNKSDKRIAASQKRGGTRTIWLRKFDSLEESVREYYKTMGRAKAYEQFRIYRYRTDDVFTIIMGLDKYSEIGWSYVEALSNMIHYNNLTKFDK